MCQKTVLSKLEHVSNKGSHFIKPARWEAKVKSIYIFTSSLLFKPLQTEEKLRQIGEKKKTGIIRIFSFYTIKLYEVQHSSVKKFLMLILRYQLQVLKKSTLIIT